MPRGVVAAALLRHPGHHTVGAIQDFIAKDAPEASGIARSSVYRALESLERAGLVVSVRTSLEETQFEWEGGHAHHHLICDECGTVTQVELSAAAALEREVAQEHGFSMHVRHLALRGRCGACREQQGHEGVAG